MNWPNILTCIAALWTAYVATRALNTWRSQTKYNTRIQFLSDLLDATHSYIEAIEYPLGMAKVIKIKVESQLDEDEYEKLKDYIKSDGAVDGQTMYTYLKEILPHTTRLKAMSAKGQIYGFVDYHMIQSACHNLVSVTDKLSGVCSIIGMTNLPWDNQEIEQTVRMVLSTVSEDFESITQEANVKIIKYIEAEFKDTYK